MASPNPSLSPVASTSPPGLPAIKDQLELAKLRAEVKSLNRPNYGVLVTAVIGVLGIGVQRAQSNMERAQATIELDMAKLEHAKLEGSNDSLAFSLRKNLELNDSISRAIQNQHAFKANLDTLIAGTSRNLDSLRAQSRALESHVTAVRQSLAAAQRTVAVGGARDSVRTATQLAISQASASVDRLGEALQQTNAYTTQTTDSLQAFRSDLRGDAMRVSLHLEKPATVSWYRLQTQQLVTTIGTLPAGDTAFVIPYGGTIFVQARGGATPVSPPKRVDCTRRATCLVRIP